MESATLDEQFVENLLALPYGKVIEVYASRSEKEILTNAMIGVCVAFGNHPQRLNTDREYSTFVNSYVTRMLSIYVADVAAQQLALLSLWGKNTTGSTLTQFAPGLGLVKSALFPNADAAEKILGDHDRTMNFLLAVTSMTAALCKTNNKVAELFGLKKKWFGGLKFTG